VGRPGGPGHGQALPAGQGYGSASGRAVRCAGSLDTTPGPA